MLMQRFVPPSRQQPGRRAAIARRSEGGLRWTSSCSSPPSRTRWPRRLVRACVWCTGHRLLPSAGVAGRARSALVPHCPRPCVWCERRASALRRAISASRQAAPVAWRLSEIGVPARRLRPGWLHCNLGGSCACPQAPARVGATCTSYEASNSDQSVCRSVHSRACVCLGACSPDFGAPTRVGLEW
jgi:hypothetical protein